MRPPMRVSVQKARGYAPYLEGLRGLAALYVVLHHAALQAYPARYDTTPLSLAARGWLSACDRGDIAVAIFIVLSGYCLMLPVAASGRLRDGALGFFRRRAQRILPAYYASLALLMAAYAWVPALGTPDGTHRDLALPALETGAVISHLLLVHNFSSDWVWKLNGPLWSVAVEWQMYGLFPLLIWVFLRWGARVGTGVGVSLAYGLTLGLHFLNPALVTRTCPWYLGLFAIGMGAAWRVQSLREEHAPRLGFLAAAALWFAAALAVDVLFSRVTWLAAHGVNANMVSDVMLAQALACVLFHCNVARTSAANARTRLQIMLENPALLTLGSFSYSLYLIHDPLLSFMVRGMNASGVGDELRVWACLGLAVPVSALCAYGFFRLFELPFLPSRSNPSVAAATLINVAPRQISETAHVQHRSAA